MKYRLLIISLLTTLFSSQLYAQKSCAEILKLSEKRYEEGDIDILENMLSPCLENGFTKEEKLEAYKVLVHVSMYSDNRVKADYYMKAFLKLDPEYSVDIENDSEDFIELYDTYNTEPIINVGFLLGINYTSPTLLENYSIGNANTNKTAYSPNKSALQYGLRFERRALRFLTVELDFIMKDVSFESKASPFEFAEVSNIETQKWIQIPVLLKYQYSKKKLKPYFGGGISYGVLMSAKMSPIRKYTGVSEVIYADVSGDEVDSKSFRKSNGMWLIADIGLNYKIPHGYIGLDCRYDFGMGNVVNEDTRYDNQELIQKYYYVDSDFSLDNLSVSLSYNYSFYNIKKKKAFRY